MNTKRPAWLPPPPPQAPTSAPAAKKAPAAGAPAAKSPPAKSPAAKLPPAKLPAGQAPPGEAPAPARSNAKPLAAPAPAAAAKAAAPGPGASAPASASAPGEPVWLFLGGEPAIADPGVGQAARPAAKPVKTAPTPAPAAADPAIALSVPPSALPAAKPAKTGTGGKAKLTPEVERLGTRELRALAIKRHKEDKYEEAVLLYQHYLAKEPLDHQALSNLGSALRAQGHYEAAIPIQRKAIAMSPREGAYWSNLGNALKDADRVDEAVEAHKQAVALNPSEGSWYHNLGVTLRESGRHQESFEAFERAIRLLPKQESYRWDRAVVLLHLGRWDEGWTGYEWRYRLKELTPRRRDIPRWLGEPIPGKTLMLHPEQGFGDTLFAVRFLPLVKERTQGRVIVLTRPPLMRLFSGVDGIDEVVPVENKKDVVCDYHASLMDLPRFFQARPDNTPMPPKLNIPADARAKAAELLAPGDGKFKVGVVWSGSVTFKNNRRRAVDVERFLPLAEVDGVQMVSLQKGPREHELDGPGLSSIFIDAGRKVQDFSETAAVIEALDLVIMTDSSVAHLCGTLGRPVWNLLNFVPYWLYGDVGDRTPWYPSMRLFRQPMPGAWDAVFAMVKSALVEAVAQKKAGQWPPPAFSLLMNPQPKSLTSTPFSSPVAKIS